MRILCIIFTLVLGACGAPTPQPLLPQMGWQKAKISTQSFTLSALYKKPDIITKEMTVYIEGDGRAWVSRSTPSGDPTPGNPVAKNLALQDESPAVAYLARPCQYEPRWLDAACKRAYWTNKRFAPETVAATNQALNTLKEKLGANKIHLVGYSGGGGMAALVAASREDIASLRTVAANLNTELFTKHHRVSRMQGSLNPVDTAYKIRQIPQLHYVGKEDSVIPALIAESFIQAQNGKCARKVVVPHTTHSQGWEEAWKKFSAQKAWCRE